MNSPVTNAADSRYMTALTTSLVSPMRPIGCSVPRPSYVSGACIGVLITPSETAFHADAGGGVLGCQRLGPRRQPALGERRQGRRDFDVGVLDQRGCDVDHMAATDPRHVPNSPPGHV